MEKSSCRVRDVQELTGLTYRQIRYWVKIGIVTPNQIQKEYRSELVFCFDNLVVIRTAMKMLDFGADFAMVRRVATWLQENLATGSEGEYLFAAEGEECRFLNSIPINIIDLIRGKCLLVVDVANIKMQLKTDMLIIERQRSKSKGRRRYTIPVIEGA